ncbi:MAG: hypothetical protein P4L82_12185 [Ancalomicrobiaceae bacterium]|nr:hypothetical protein [Ancalomicrobiaceae bacterium]
MPAFIGARKVATLSKGVRYDPAAVAFFARLTTPPTTPLKALYNNVFVSLRASGLLTRLDCLKLRAADNAQAARQNLIQNAYNDLAMNSPSFTVNRGYTGDGSTSYLDTRFDPLTAPSPNYSRNSASISVYVTTGSISGTMYDAGSSGNSRIDVNGVGNNINSRINDTSNPADPNGGVTSGLFTVSRTDSTTRTVYLNGVSVGSSTAASIAVANANFFSLAQNNAGSGSLFSTRRNAAEAIGGGLSAADVANLYNAIYPFLAAIGAQ